jgi:predicted N-acyltransferase
MQAKYEVRVLSQVTDVSQEAWASILPSYAGPFMQHSFLSLLEKTGCVSAETGWKPSHLALYEAGGETLLGALPLYLKTHSYGEYVFDWSWAEAYAQAGLPYFPKALSAIPFTPVTSSRLLARLPEHQEALITGLKQLVQELSLSSAHILFPIEGDAKLLSEAGFLNRESVQFHWHNNAYIDFESFLSTLTMKRRKNIKRERKQVQSTGITFEHLPGESLTEENILFFYRCYRNTYQNHYSTPYLNQLFFQEWAQQMPRNLHLIVAKRDGQAIASALLIVDHDQSKAYGRYWGCLEQHPCLHFETAFYQAIEYCIRERIQTLEGGAQGEHKMARGFMPTTVSSYHYLSDPRFQAAVARFLERERQGVGQYLDELAEHSPVRQGSYQSSFGRNELDALK